MGYINDALRIVYGDCTLGVHGRDFDYLFSYQHGGLESLVIDEREWLYRVPKPAFWRATTDNDRGNGFPLRSGMWMGADMFISCTGIEIIVDGTKIEMPTAPLNNRYSEGETAKKIQIIFTYQTITVPSARVNVSYEVTPDGSIKTDVHYFGNDKLPELPLFGLRFVMPTAALGYRYEGLSGETYPDRMCGAGDGTYEIEGLPVTKYLVPQDCNVHMETNWLEVYRNKTHNNSRKDNNKFGIKFLSLGKKFAFSCIPYTALELESATHQEELPAARRTVVTILGAVRGVGGINSWGADVEPAYHINAGEDISYSFLISRILTDTDS
ncbi:beta-galactosidase small subunit [Anaerocolumna xylanovorans]|uniref:beta-galactosidase n=1 Tax=Anaerocolumna xylanovorans DSM 12503 TaxID=1121345 RepID=A0A1M7YHA2_9FIRM|nr:beta-galactosidase small subunit [Anaerocolumna xylanovorans]SHO52012.1 beta-galactosidase [Anaerocolumna xylanovorans DSM 12503]